MGARPGSLREVYGHPNLGLTGKDPPLWGWRRESYEDGAIGLLSYSREVWRTQGEQHQQYQGYPGETKGGVPSRSQSGSDSTIGARSMSASTRSYLKIIGLTVFGLIAAGAITVMLMLNSIRDPLGSRNCECELLKEWATMVRFIPEGSHPELDEVRVAESHMEFVIGGIGFEGVTVDRQAMIDALAAHGINHRVAVDQPDRWDVAFFPGGNALDGPWSLDVTARAAGAGITLRVVVDGSLWGLNTIEDLWDSYQEDYQSALAVQVERQEEAIRILRPLQQALESMVEEE